MALYEEVADRIEGFISKGIYEPGERLPSIRRLAGHSPAVDAALPTAGSIARGMAHGLAPVLQASAS
jgi:hypothetical protein